MSLDAYYRAHSRRRAAERFGIKLTRNARATIKAIIDTGRAEYIGTGDLGRPMFRVPLDSLGRAGQWAKVVCDRETGQLVTLLPD